MPSIDHTVLSLFHYYSWSLPDALAIEVHLNSVPDQTPNALTYAQLDEASSKISVALRDHGVRPRDAVPLLTSRSLTMVVAMLGILKAGASYVPVDVAVVATERIETILKLVEAPLIVTTTEVDTSITAQYTTMRINMDESTGIFDYRIEIHLQGTRDKDKNCENEQLESILSPQLNDPAYIIFTSGTTGVPKGVVVSHGSIANYVQQSDPPFNFNVRPGSRVLLIQSVSFDACTGILFSTLCNGGTVVIADFSSLPEVSKQCNILALTPSTLETLDHEAGYDQVESIFLGGESPSSSLIQRWSTPCRRIYNGYGPTETTCASLMAELLPGMPVTLGRSMNNSRVILVEDGKESDDAGEIFISGPGLAIGYHRDEERTSAAFVYRNGVRYYRTGDMAKKVNNELIFCGRRDMLVKNRGYLINLETEVEPGLMSHPGVQAAIALIWNQKLVAFVKPSTVLNEDVKRFLRDKLSDFLIPDIIHGLDVIPMMANGKVDRNALRKTLQAGSSNGETHEVDISDGAPLKAQDALITAISRALGVSSTSIDPDSSFRDLGGNSLTAVAVVTILRRLGFSISAGQILALDKISIVENELRRNGDRKPGRQRGSRAELTSARMLDMHRKLVHGSVTDPTANIIRFSMTFDHDGIKSIGSDLKVIFGKLLNRHQIFHLVYRISSLDDFAPLHYPQSMDWQTIETTVEDHDESCRGAEEYSHTVKSESDGEYIRLPCVFRLIAIPNIRSRLIWTVHHGMVDGWSISILLRELACIANGETLADPVQFPTASMQVNLLGDDRHEAALEFWDGLLTPHLPPCQMPSFGESITASPNTVETSSQLQYNLDISPAEVDHWTRRCETSAATLFSGAWAMLLGRYCDTNHVIMGSTFAGRDLPVDGIETVVGPLVNVLPLGVKIDDRAPVLSLMQVIFASICSVSQYQWASTALIKQATGLLPSELFQSVIAMQWDIPSLDWQTTRFSAPRDYNYRETTDLPLSLLIDSHGNSYSVQCIYQTTIYSKDSVERMMGHYRNILHAILDAPTDKPVGAIQRQMLSELEVSNLVDCFPRLHEPLTGPMTVIDAWDQAVRLYPELTAIESVTGSTSYLELDGLVERVAFGIKDYAGASCTFAILCDGSPNWVVAIVACVKLGVTYCPVDINLPLLRQQLLLRESRASLILLPNEHICDRNLLKGIGIPTESIPRLLITQLHSPGLVPPQVNTEAVAVIIFTSGSTGIPKGVPLQHQAICSALREPRLRLHSKPGQRNAQCVTLGFDLCALELFSSLCFGATLVLKDPDDSFAHLSHVDAMVTTPTFLSTLDSGHYSNLKIVLVGGEPVHQKLVDRWAPGRTLINVYGPTECTFACLTTELYPDTRVHLGYAPSRLAYSILDSRQQVVPNGIVGELCVSGIQVSPGYVNHEQETASRFLSDPYRLSMPMYRTGDIVRRTAEGLIEYVGRRDFQVKLRGYRVDLEDLEVTVGNVCPEINGVAIVLVDRDRLVAFVTPGSVVEDALRDRVAAVLPSYCMINEFIAMDSLPLAATNKVDRQKLRELAVSRPRHIERLQSRMENVVAEIWQRAIGKQCPHELSALDHFFRVGGHSILQVRVSNFLTAELGMERLLPIVLRHPVLRDLAHALDEYTMENDGKERRTEVRFAAQIPNDFGAYLPVSPLEENLWHLYQNASVKSAFHMASVAHIDRHVDAWRLAKAFQHVIKSHDIFCSTWKMLDGRLVRVVDSAPAAFILAVDVPDKPAFIQQQIDRPFDLLNDHGLRIIVIQLSPQHFEVIVVMVHIIGDATTLSNFMHDGFAFYSTCENKQLHSTIGDRNHARDLSYADWALWMNKQPVDQTNLTFWKDQLKELPSGLGFGMLPQNPHYNRSYTGLSHSRDLEPSLAQSLDTVSNKLGVTKQHIAMTCVALASTIYSPDNDPNIDMVLGMPYANRREPGTESMMGLFLDSIPVRYKYDFTDLMRAISTMAKCCQESMEHYMPSTQLVQTVFNGESTPRSNPLFGVMVSFHLLKDNDLGLLQEPSMGEVSDIRSIEVRSVFPSGAKFPLMVEFFEGPRPKDIRVRVECDDEIFAEEKMNSLEEALTAALEALSRPFIC